MEEKRNEWRKRGTRRVYVGLLHSPVECRRKRKEERLTDANNEGRVGKLLLIPYSVREHRRTSEVTPISPSM